MAIDLRNRASCSRDYHTAQEINYVSFWRSDHKAVWHITFVYIIYYFKLNIYQYIYFLRDVAHKTAFVKVLIKNPTKPNLHLDSAFKPIMSLSQ